MKIRLILGILALLFAVGCSSDKGTTTPPIFEGLQKYAKNNEIKIMSFNVRTQNSADGEYNWPNRKEACVALIKDQKPAIIGFQEAQYERQWLYLKEQLADEYDGWGVNRDSGKESGNGEAMGILYNRSLVRKIDGGTFWLSETPDKCSRGWDAACNRTATWGIFEHIATGKKFYYINTHLDHEGKEAQEKGMALIASYFDKYDSAEYAKFFTGDLNIQADSPYLDVLDGKMINTRYAAPASHSDGHATFNGYTSDHRRTVIDHIYCTLGMKVPEYHTITERYGGIKFVSDHYPIYAIVKMD